MGWYEEEKIAYEIDKARYDVKSELQDLKEAQIRANQQANRRLSEPLPPEVKKKLLKAGLWIFVGFAAFGGLSSIGIFIICLLYNY